MKLIKSREHKEIFELDNGVKRWIENWNTFVYLGHKIEDVEIIPLQKLKVYPVGSTKTWKTVTIIIEGKKPKDIFYPDEPEVEIRKISILGTCLPGCESMMEDLRFTHAYGNRYDWPNYDEVERLGMKVFVNIRGDVEELTEQKIRNVVFGYENQKGKWVTGWKDRPGCGGYWCDQYGHEPDICNQSKESREWFYKIVRKYDPDKQGHPVMEMFDNTATGDFPPEQHPGYTLAWSDLTHDIMLVDYYPDMSKSHDVMREQMLRSWELLKEHAHKHQVIIQMIAGASYERGKVRFQYEFWKEKMASVEFDNPYRGKMGVCFYADSDIRKNTEMQREIQEVNEEVAKGV